MSDDSPAGPTLANAPTPAGGEPISAETARVIREDAATPATDPPETKDVGSKPHGIGMDADFVTMVGPFGGAETFADYDDWKDAVQVQGEVDTLTFAFDGLIQNIRSDPELTLAQKATKIAQVAGELGRRVEAQNSSHRDEDDKALDVPASESFWFEAKDFGYTYTDGQQAAAEKAATKRGSGVELRASDFADVPDADEPSTWKLPLVRGRSGAFDLGRIADAITAMQPGGLEKSSVASRIRGAIGRASGDAGRKTELRDRLAKVKADGGSFRVFKDKAGQWRWFTMHSNGYRDKEGERFAKEAHDEFVRWVDQDKAARMPELRVFHVPGSSLGRADLIDHTSEGFMIGSGTFSPEMEYVAKGLAERDDLGCSHGFWFDPDAFRDGVYHRYRSFEISILPRERAANEVTGFIAGKEVPMPLSPEKKAELVSTGGQEWADGVETGLAKLAEDADEKGLSYKDVEAGFLAALTPPETKAEPPPADPPPPAEPTTEALTAITSAVAAVAEQVKTIAATQVQHNTQLEALKESNADQIAEAFRPRFDPTKGFVASESEGNQVADDDPAAKEADGAAAVPKEMSGYIGEGGQLRGFGVPGLVATPEAPA